MREYILCQCVPIVSDLPVMNASVYTKMDRMTNTSSSQDALVN